MADAFRGLTIRLGADERPLVSAISSVQRSASQANKQLNAMKKALKFDGNDIDALGFGIDLARDKAEHAARSMVKIRTAMEQASKETKDLASGTSKAYSETQRLKDEYVHVDAELQHIYDSMAKVLQRQGLTEKEAVEYVRIMRDDVRGLDIATDDAAKGFRDLLAEASKSTNINRLFGQQKGDAEALLSTLTKLKERHVELNAAYDQSKAVDGYRAMQTQLVSWRSSLHQAAAEAVDFKAKMYSLGKTGELIPVRNEIKLIEAGLDDARNSASRMEAVFTAMPKSMEAARAKVVALKTVQEAAKSKIEALGRELAIIENMPGFNAHAAATKDVYTALAKAKDEATKANAKLEEEEEILKQIKLEAKELATAFDKIPDEKFDELKAKERDCEQRVKQYREEVKRADRELENAQMEKTWRETKNAEAEAIVEAERYDSVVKGFSGWKNTFGTIRTMGYGLSSTITPAITMIGRYSIQAAEDIDAAYRDMRKTVNGTEEDFEHLKDAAIDFSLTHVTSAEQMLEIEAIGGQLGIQVENLESFAHTVSNLDIATNMDTESIAESLGQLSNIMRDMDQSIESGPGSLDSFSDALVRLGNNSATQEDKIMNVMMRIASMGTISNMATPDLLALSTAVAASGQGAEAAGTAIARTFSNIESAVAGPEKAMADFKDEMLEDGESVEDFQETLEKSSKKLEKFAKVAGMSAEEFAAGWNSSDSKVVSNTFQAFIEGLRRIDAEGGSVDATLSDLGINGVRQKQTIENLLNTFGKYNEFREMSNAAWNGEDDRFGNLAGDAEREAERKSEGFSGSMEKMRHAAEAFGMALAEGATPFVKMFTEQLTALAKVVTEMPDWAKTAVVGIGGVIAALGPLTIAVGAVGTAVTSIPDIVTKFTSHKNLKAALKEMDAVGMTVGNVQYKFKEAAGEAGKLGKGTSKLAAAFGSLGSVGTVGVAAFAVAFAMLGAGIADAVAKANTFKKATDGLTSSVDKISKAFSSNAEFSIDISADEIANKLTSLADTINSTMTDVTSNTGLAQHYADEIKKIREQWTGSREDVLKLQAAVEGYNEATGSSIEITNLETGALSVSTQELERNTAAYVANAKSKAAQSLYEEALKAAMEIEPQIEKAKKVYEQAREAYDRYGTDESWLNFKLAKDNLEQLEAEYYSATQAAETFEGMLLRYDDLAATARQSTDDFRAALEGVSGNSSAFDELAEMFGVNVDDFAAGLAASGVRASEFAKVAIDKFDEINASAHGDIEAIIGKLEELNLTRSEPYVGLRDDATWRINNILESLDAVNRSKATAVIDVVQNMFSPQNAAGGVSGRIISAIPRNAAGGINGIVTRPTLTNVGWVGEAGDEALLHMKNAGGAIIPLSNRQHVRPFAQAVASEMSGGAMLGELRSIRREMASLQGFGGVNIYVTVDGSSGDFGEIGRQVGREAAYEMRMQGVCA